MLLKPIKQYLDSADVEYLCMSHPPAFSARELAKHVGIAGDQVVKTVIIELDGKMAMLVMPATWRVSWHRLSQILDTDFVELADEQMFQSLFPQCEVGAMPPFGELYGMNVYCAEALTQEPELAFAAGSHSKSIHMKTADFLALARPTILDQGFNKPGAVKPAWLLKRKQPPASESTLAL